MSQIVKVAAVAGVSGLVSGLVGMTAGFVAIAVGQGASRRRKAKAAAATLDQANAHIAEIKSRLTVVPGGVS